MAGLRGTFNDDWRYEISANYGRMKERTDTFGFVDRQRFMLSMDAGLNPATGQIQCRAQFDPASALAFDRPDLSADPRAALQSRLAADIAACVRYNPFGGGDNRAASRYFTFNARNRAVIDRTVFSGFVSGDSSQLFELPGYRKLTLASVGQLTRFKSCKAYVAAVLQHCQNGDGQNG